MYELQPSEEEGGLGTIRYIYLNSMKTRFNNIEENKVYVCATYLDPRFKKDDLSPKANTKAIQWLREEFETKEDQLNSHNNRNKLPLPSCSFHSSSTEIEIDHSSSFEPPTKKIKMNFWEYYKRTLPIKKEKNLSESKTTFEKEIERYDLHKTENHQETPILNVFACMRQSAAVKSALCAHQIESEEDSNVPHEERNLNLKRKIKLLYKIIDELEDKNRLLVENCDLLKEKVKFLTKQEKNAVTKKVNNKHEKVCIVDNQVASSSSIETSKPLLALSG
ncbi:unnamed protein product [Brassicogethes aeneus]|uniref:Uncharacterized protein n=1 Tax=Brassicogethes aeneus TaxID=1431903 RepID=A0A9P0FGB6_BRAAE|nr:unnamed protein product [Brassicogethes aeneus]